MEKTSYVLGSELWEQNFKSLLRLVTEFIVNVWEVRKQNLYGDDSCPNQLQSQSSPGGLEGATGVEGQRDGKFREGKLHCVCYASVAACNVFVDACACICGCKCKCDNVHSCMDTCTCMCSSAIVVGAWPTAGALWRLFEYYYYYLPPFVSRASCRVERTNHCLSGWLSRATAALFNAALPTIRSSRATPRLPLDK